MNTNDIFVLINAVLVIVDVYLYKVYVMDVKNNLERDEELGSMLDDIYPKRGA